MTITVRKPSALPFAVPAINITRSRGDYEQRALLAAAETSAAADSRRVFIAVGSNIGDRVDHIRRALQELQANGCTLVDTSRLYESKPMYVEDQDWFMNGAIEVG